MSIFLTVVGFLVCIEFLYQLDKRVFKPYREKIDAYGKSLTDDLDRKTRMTTEQIQRDAQELGRMMDDDYARFWNAYESYRESYSRKELDVLFKQYSSKWKPLFVNPNDYALGVYAKDYVTEGESYE